MWVVRVWVVGGGGGGGNTKVGMSQSTEVAGQEVFIGKKVPPEAVVTDVRF